MDMSERHLQRLENSESPISRVHAHAFADYYGVAIKEIDGQADVAA